MSIYKTIENYLKEGKTGAIATVISREGSAPREAGAKMFVGEDGKVYGTIGGGSLEFGVYKQAMTHMDEYVSKLIHIRMDNEEVASDGMICGGNVDVFLEPVMGEHLELYKRLEHLEKSGQDGVLITSFSHDNFKKTLLEEDMGVTGIPLTEKEKKTFQEHLEDTIPIISGEVLIEPLHFLPKLYIFGAGHISQFISIIASLVDFYVVIIDDRSEFACYDRFPEADEILVEEFDQVFNHLQFTGKEYVVIVTRGHQYDSDVLQKTLQKDTKYVGMIGSKRKVKMILEHMKECGFDDEKIQNVHSPIGLPIHAETPQEIAVSIMAEIIEVRRKSVD